ncbi:MAG: DUF1707 domain-containing protein [Actinomycetota bacterium]|nr:DUF1707 domain-containing protein [Actinomycetota bacterium]
MDERLPARLPSGDERDAAAARLSQARRDGRLVLAEFCDRIDAVYTADSIESLEQITTNLPAAAPVGISSPPVFSLFGDIVVSGRWRAGDEVRVRTVFGDARIDLAEAITDDDVLHVRCATTFGDVCVQVPEGVEVELTGLSVFGDRRLELAALPRIPGTPLIKVHASTIFGDVRVRSAGVPQAASVWRRAVGRLRPVPPEHPAPPT